MRTTPRALVGLLMSVLLAAAMLAVGPTGSAAAMPAEPGPTPAAPLTAAPLTAAPLTAAPLTAAVPTAAANPVAGKISLAPGLKGFDNIGADGAGTLQCLSNGGYSFDVIDALGAGWDAEYRSAAAIGMSVVLFQGYYQPLWSSAANGTSRGRLMATNAASVGYPRGAQVFLNLENNVTDGTNKVSHATMISWVKNWAAAVRAAGYSAGVYVGVPQLLTAAELNSIPGLTAFWRSASGSAPQVPKGYVLRQPSIDAVACGTTIDTNTSGADAKGGGLVGAGFPRAATRPSSLGAFGPLTPARVLDTRSGSALPARGTRPVAIRGVGGVPATNVSAVVLTVTVVNPNSGGYLTVYPGGAKPSVSNLNFARGQTVANLVTVPVGSDGRVQIFNGSGAASNVIADVSGYYLGGTPTASGAFQSVAPFRVADTRPGSPVPGLASHAVPVLGRGQVPTSGVSAVVVNLTVVAPAAAGYLTAYRSGSAKPNSSNLNFVAGQTVPNLVLVPVGADGQIQVFNGSTKPADALVDVAGYYLAGQPAGAGLLGTVGPARILDTRPSVVPAATARAVQATGKGGIPTSGVAAVVINVTATGPTAGGYVTAYPSGANRPTASNLNFAAKQTVANLVVVPVGLDGKIVLFNGSGGAVQLIGDVVGYIAG